ncbi:MAG: response regulator [Spirochaetales bacterium]|nr:response regulator [Spirochaetales bacterium]MCF7938194.1 response regulator [Spirochaetales bacterium]
MAKRDKDKKVRIYSALEVANICGVVNQTAINWIKNNYLKAFTTPGGQYRVYADDLIEFLEERGMRIPPDLATEGHEKTDPSVFVVIDDDREVNDVVTRLLRERMPSVTVYQAYDGFEAGRKIAEKKPRYIILDLNLPGIDGFQLCENVKSDDGLDGITVVAISGLDDASVEERIREKGADLFFPKPIDFPSFISRVQELVDVP